MVVIHYSQKRGTTSKWFRDACSGQKELKRLFKRKIVATMKDGNGNIIGKVWQADDGRWNYYYDSSPR